MINPNGQEKFIDSKENGNISTATACISKEGKKSELRELKTQLKHDLQMCKMKDMTQIGERMKRTEERIQQYYDENRVNEAEQETTYLNELKQLKVLSEEISLKITVFFSKAIDQLNLSELENRLKYGLEKCKIKDVIELTERIKRTERRIDEYEDQDRRDEVEQEMNYLRDLEKLQRIVKEIFFRKSNETTSINNDNTLSQKISVGEIISHEERENVENLLEDLVHIPCCAEKTIMELLADFQQRLLGDSRVDKTFDSTFLKLQTLKDQIYNEELISETLRNYLQDLNRTVNNEDCSSTDKNIILLVGATGSGKSTTIQFLAGAKMKDTLIEIAPGKFVKHIATDGPVKNAQLSCVKTNPLSTSETRYILPVTVQLKHIFGDHETGEIILCDASGFDNTEGSEFEIANSVGLAEALRSCKSIKMLALSSYRSLGDNGEGIHKLVHILANIISDIEHRLYVIVFLNKEKGEDTTPNSMLHGFTKFAPTNNIHEMLIDIKSSTSDVNSDLRLDNTFIAVLNDMIDKTRDTTDIIDLVHGDPKILIKKLKKLEGIRYPSEVFRFSISQNTKHTI
ncbi:unnamed protein product [Rotaria magnacalcarata]|uniref:Uncharacterized protein n=5 Tax=Rotaria magnacalcarata TaxID=392030 RepID=A0A815Z9Q1_9BILA|nr:unnamed protein product [Rotaria magnacalcarata]CAF4122276.1 unnamed protein product [Rotaria magnacalcarata]